MFLPGGVDLATLPSFDEIIAEDNRLQMSESMRLNESMQRNEDLSRAHSNMNRSQTLAAPGSMKAKTVEGTTTDRPILKERNIAAATSVAHSNMSNGFGLGMDVGTTGLGLSLNRRPGSIIGAHAWRSPAKRTVNYTVGGGLGGGGLNFTTGGGAAGGKAELQALSTLRAKAKELEDDAEKLTTECAHLKLRSEEQSRRLEQDIEQTAAKAAENTAKAHLQKEEAELEVEELKQLVVQEKDIVQVKPKKPNEIQPLQQNQV